MSRRFGNIRWDEPLDHQFAHRHEQPPHDEKRAKATWAKRWGFRIGKHYPCPTRWLTRRQCQGEGCCWFSGGSHPTALDHVYGITRLEDGQRGLLAMPYGLTDDAAATLSGWCRKRGLTWTVLGDGWHFTGTVAIVMLPEPS